MPNFEPGESVAIPATIQQGAFPGEHLVTVQTSSGAVSGFVRDQDIVEPNKTIRGVVRKLTSATLEVELSGSYFTTNGLVALASDPLLNNVKVIA